MKCNTTIIFKDGVKVEHSNCLPSIDIKEDELDIFDIQTYEIHEQYEIREAKRVIVDFIQ